MRPERKCITCGGKIEAGLARACAVECHDCKRPTGSVHRPGSTR